ncbi:hypothetical protein JXB22_04100 [candidate division WOR-3 bacterium]|nr:hypothetical protein [candidate division WOR-3 bacterium]
MRNIGLILMIIGIIVAFLGIRASCAIHSANMANPTETPGNDLPSILFGIFGFVVLFVGWVFFVRPMRKKHKPVG